MGVLWVLNEHAPCTFRELQDHCESISPGVLNTRLAELRAAGLITRGDKGYEVTESGRALYGHLVPLGAWAKIWAAKLED